MRSGRKRWRNHDGRAAARDAIDRVLHRYGAHTELREHRIATYWRDIVGELVASRAWPDGLDQGVLWVRVKSSSWMHQLSFLRSEIATRANQIVGDPPLVNEVRFHLGPRARASADDVLASTARIHRPPAEPRQLPPPAGGPRLRAIESEAAAVNDDELRRLIVEFRRRWDL